MLFHSLTSNYLTTATKDFILFPYQAESIATGATLFRSIKRFFSTYRQSVGDLLQVGLLVLFPEIYNSRELTYRCTYVGNNVQYAFACTENVQNRAK